MREVLSPRYYCSEGDLFHSSGVVGGYKVGFAAGCLLHSVAKVLRDVSGVSVSDCVRRAVIRRWSETASSLPHLRGLLRRDFAAAFAVAHEPRTIREGELRYIG